MRLLLNRARGLLVDDRGNAFDPAARQWTPTFETGDGDPVSPAQALRWVQRDSHRPVRVPVAVVGTRAPTPAQSAAATRIGELLADHGVTVICGGRSGVMEDVCRGVAAAGGLSIGLLPDTEADAANSFVTVPIATGIGVARNALIARAALCMVAIGGGHGTLSEIAFALQFARPVFLLENAPSVDGAKHCADVDEALDGAARTFLALSPSEAA